MYDGCILPRKYYSILYASSYLSLISVVYASYREYYTLSCIPGSVFLTSILYWQRPDYSWRRTVDMAVVNTALVMNCYVAWWAQRGWFYYGITSFAVCLYIVARELYKRGYLLESTVCHAGLHLFANIANLVMYSGNIYL